MANKKLFFHFYFLNKEYLAYIQVNILKFPTDVKNILMEGSVSQISDLGLSFCFMPKYG